jgi:hypothetical protein
VRFFSFFPQFCQEPLNDEAWGRGFTDWDLIRRLTPDQAKQFTPAAGFYDPTDSQYLNKLEPEVSAVAGSNAGLMVYHYYFDGVHALNGFEKALLDRKSSIPFFLCWANETWSKRWEGKANQIIIRQMHRLDRHLIASHAAYLAKFFELESYLRVNDQPIFVFYEPHSVTHMSEVVAEYRSAFAAIGTSPLFGACLSYPQSGIAKMGFDFAIEFEPRYFFNMRRGGSRAAMGLALKKRLPGVFDRVAAFRERFSSKVNGEKIIDYSEYLKLVSSGQLEVSLRSSADNLPLVRSTFLSWNNQPRYRSYATKVSLDRVDGKDFLLLKDVQSDKGFPLIVNSWNEWSEGAAFEPAMLKNSLKDDFLRSVGSF